VEGALLQLLEPVKGRFTAGNAGLHLGDFAAHYGEASAHMEAFSRMLWGLAPLWSQGGGADWLPLFRQGLLNGTAPNHPAYWGPVADYDQKIVEMAAISLTLMLCGETMDFSPRESENLHRWLAGVEGRALPQNNWLFFRVLVQTAFRRMGWPWNREQLDADLDRLEDWYLGEGWYCDGQPSQVDYYIPFGIHYYGLIYAHFMERDDPIRARRFRDRAARFAQDFLYWFEDGGRAVPFGRSLTYRFGQCAFFSALAFAGVESLPWGVIKSRVLGNLWDFDPDRDRLPVAQLEELDRYALHTFGQLAGTVRAAYERYEFHAVYRAVYNFCVVDMSNFYLDIIKDRLYCEEKDGLLRRSAQTALWLILDTITKLFAPILAFTCDEIWLAMPHREGDDPRNVLLNEMNKPFADYALDQAAMERWEEIIKTRDTVNAALEQARNEKKIGKSLEARVTLKTADPDRFLLPEMDEDSMADVFIVSQVSLEKGEGALTVEVAPAQGQKCERCWKVLPAVGADAEHPTLCPRCAAAVRSLPQF